MLQKTYSLFSISRFRIILAAVISIALIIIYWCVLSLSLNSDIKSIGSREISNTYCEQKVNSDNTFMQSFFIHGHCRLNKINIQLSNQGNVSTDSNSTFEIIDKFGNVLFNTVVNTNDICSNGFTSINTNGIELDGISRYFVQIKYNGNNADAALPVLNTVVPNSCNDVLYCNDLSVQNQVLNIYYDYETIPVGLKQILVLFGLILLVFISVMLNKRYFKYVPFIFFIPIALTILYGAWRCGYWVNQTLYDIDISQKSFIACVSIVIILAIIIFYVGKTKMGEYVSKITRQVDRKSIIYTFAAFFLAILFILQISMASRIYQRIGWDVNEVVKMVKNLYLDGSVGNKLNYLSLFPNNKGIAVIFYAIIKLFHLTEYKEIYWHLTVVNIIFIDLSLIVAYKVAKKIFGRFAALITTIFMLILLGLSGWIVVPYTDTFSVWIPVFIMWLYLKQKEIDNNKLCLAFWGIIGLMSVIGYHIKPQCVIVTIAIILIEIINIVIKRNWLHSVCYLSCIAGVLVGTGVFILVTNVVFGEENHSDKSVPAVHFLMMGASENPTSVGFGGYNKDDTSGYTYNFDTTDEKKEACIKRLSHEIKAYGFAGYTKHLWDKAEWILGDGSFSWGMEGEFFMKDYSLNKKDRFQNFLRDRLTGNKKKKYFGMITGIWLTILLLFIIPIGRTRWFGDKVIVYLAALGCIAFTLLFEGRSRYLINYIPFFCIIASGTLKTILIRKKN